MSAPFCSFNSMNLTIDLMWRGLWSTASWEVLRELESNINSKIPSFFQFNKLSKTAESNNHDLEFRYP